MLDISPGTKIDTALAKLERALASGDIDAAVNLFQADCYWRDLVTFTWNLKTLEGHEQIRDMLGSQLAATKPSNFVQDTKEAASESGGVTEGWFDHLGCFAYQPEPGTRSARLFAPPAKEGLQRQKKIMAAQKKVSRKRLARLKGQNTEVLVLGPHPESELLWQGRLSSQAPEVDGEVIITSGSARPGTMAPAVITKTHAYDVEAELLE